jgi:hypothetical protein
MSSRQALCRVLRTVGQNWQISGVCALPQQLITRSLSTSHVQISSQMQVTLMQSCAEDVAGCSL